MPVKILHRSRCSTVLSPQSVVILRGRVLRSAILRCLPAGYTTVSTARCSAVPCGIAGARG